MSETITTNQVKNVAQLSRLKLDEQQIQQMKTTLSDVLDYISQLNELDVSNVEPMAHAHDLTNALRQDIPTPGLPVEIALQNAPEKEGNFFKVPKILGDGPGA